MPDGSEDRLKAARISAGYPSAAAAAQAMGIKSSTYSAHENGQNGISPRAAKRYAAAFGTDWNWLMGEETAPPNNLASGAARQVRSLSVGGTFDAKPQSEMWFTVIEAAVKELGETQEVATIVAEICISVANAPLPPNLGLTEQEYARDLVQKAMQRRNVARLPPPR